MIGISATLVPLDPTIPVSSANPMVDISRQLPASQWRQNLNRPVPSVPSNVKPQPVVTAPVRVTPTPAPIITQPIPTPTILAPVSTQAIAATQAPAATSPVVSMQALNQDQVAMAKSMGYATPDNMSSGQLARVNAALADSATRTQTQQAGSSGGGSVNVGTSVPTQPATQPTYSGLQPQSVLPNNPIVVPPLAPSSNTGVMNPNQVGPSPTSTNAQQQTTGNTSAGGATSTDTTNAAFSLSDFISQNSTMLMVLAAAVVGYMMLGGESEPKRRRY